MIKIKNSLLFLIFLCSFTFAEIKIGDVKNENKADTVVVLVFDKLTSKSYKHSIKVGDTIKFNRINITSLFCWKSLPNEFTENKALIKINGTDIDGVEKEFFYGWFFSSSPSISVFEHPIYAVKLLDCKNSNIGENIEFKEEVKSQTKNKNKNKKSKRK